MTSLEDLRPKTHRRLIDLVSEAGIDVTPWSDFDGGARKAASNPKYCYEWSFIEPDRFVVLNVWHRDIRRMGAAIVLQANLRASGRRHGEAGGAANLVWQRRSGRFDEAVALAHRAGLPVRAIICDGLQRRESASRASKVQGRALDPSTWAVESYDANSGAFTLVRGPLPTRLVDQFSADADGESPTETRPTSGVVFVRSKAVRDAVLSRASGRCEWCRQPGFTTAAGDTFLETHHVIPLGEGGRDVVANVVALCPNHHREAHFGSARVVMRQKLLKAAGVSAPHNA